MLLMLMCCSPLLSSPCDRNPSFTPPSCVYIELVPVMSDQGASMSDGIGSLADDGGLNLPISTPNSPSPTLFDPPTIFLADTWVFWYDDSPLKASNTDNDINVKILGEFSTIQVCAPSPSSHSSSPHLCILFVTTTTTPIHVFMQQFWGLWRHLNTLELLPDYSNIRLFRKGILPVWEDPSNTNGGKWVCLPLSPPPPSL